MNYQVYRYDRVVDNKNIPIGVDLPMNPFRGSNFKMNYTSLDQAKANLVNLLLTNKGERVMQPTFGCDLKKAVFDNMTDDLEESIKTVIADAITTWLPYIFINSLSINFNYNNYQLDIQLTISLLNNKLDTRSVQLEINLQ